MGAGPRVRAQPLGFSDAAGTDAVPVLNHEAVKSELMRAHNVHDDEAPGRQLIITSQVMVRRTLICPEAKS